MAYVDGFLAAVPKENKKAYVDLSAWAAKKFRAWGALDYVECWGDDIPDGEVTSFAMAVQAKEDEVVVFSWIVWPDKAARDAARDKMINDPEMGEMAIPFDMKRLIYGGFSPVFEMNARASG